MTSIPVRKGTSINRGGVLKENTSGNSAHTENDRKRNILKENKTNPRPLVRQSSKKQLEDENARLHHEILTYEKQISTLESTLGKTQNDLKQSQEDCVKTKERCERTLLTCSIDPVTLEKISPGSDDENKLVERRNNAKEQISAFKDKLQTLNSQASSCIKRLNDMSSDLGNIGACTTETPSEENGSLTKETTAS